MTRLASTGNTIDLSGIDDHTIQNLELVQAGGVTQTPKGDIIIIINQTAWMPDGRTIISTGQLEHFKVQVDERSKHVTGKTPRIITLEGYEIPISTRRGLPYITLRPICDDERIPYRESPSPLHIRGILQFLMPKLTIIGTRKLFPLLITTSRCRSMSWGDYTTTLLMMTTKKFTAIKKTATINWLIAPASKPSLRT
jgi:hypothetical protein